MVLPFRNVSLPENSSVEGISCNQLPLRWQLDRNSTSLIHDVEHATIRGHEGAHAGHAVMMARPLWTADPLQMARRIDDIIMRDGIATGIMQVMRPLVDIVRTGLDSLLPLTTCISLQYDSIRHKYTQDFFIGNKTLIFNHDKVDKVIYIGQRFACELQNRDIAIFTCRSDRLSGSISRFGLFDQSLYLNRFAGS